MMDSHTRREGLRVTAAHESLKPPDASDQIHFITGRLAAGALERILQPLASRLGFRYTIEVMPITVAALLTPAWVARRLHVPTGTTRILVPGYCSGDLRPLESVADGIPVERGPRDLQDLPEYFGQQHSRADYGAHAIQIVAEINHAPRLPRDEILNLARRYAGDGADIIDIGCEPGEPWSGVAECVKMLRDQGLPVSIDSLQPKEISAAVRAGAQLVLSVNSQNRHAAPDWGCEVVVIPDDPASLSGFDETVAWLADRGVAMRLDPILEPIGCGFSHSLGRYLAVRERYPDAEMMMGIGNLTELSDCDSAGINLLLLGFCAEQRIHSVLTTEVINWARSSVRECDLARRLVHYAIQHGIPPKHLEPALVMLRDPKINTLGQQAIDQLAAALRDNNYRLFAEREQLHLISGGVQLAHHDPFVLFNQLLASGPDGTPPKILDLAHAFYLGYEAAKAVTALTLGKNYRQDEALNWGLLTRPETSHRRPQNPPSP